jgi:hypothetical protein
MTGQKEGSEKSSKTDYGDSIPFRFDRCLPSFCSAILDSLHTQLLSHQQVEQTRSRVAEKNLAALSCLLANLIAAAGIGTETFVAVPRGENVYKKSRYNKAAFGYTHATNVLDFFEAIAWVDFKSGFYDRSGKTARGKRSRYRLTRIARRILAGYIVICERDLPPIGRPLLHLAERTAARFMGDATTATFQNVGHLHQATCDGIRLKDASGNLIEYEDSDETNRMRSDLDIWNEFLDDHHIDLLVSDRELLSVFKTEDEEVEERAFFSDERERPKYVELDRCRLHRVFNNASFQQGGRFYGGWWQRVPSKYRRAITINGHLTDEFDYSNLHAAMLYAKVGSALGDDAYSLPNVSDEFRKLIKKTFFKLINAEKGQRIAPPRMEALPPGLSWEALQKAIVAKHEPIAEFLHSGAGLELQRIDSDIAEDVMLTLMAKDILVLPVHDSFVTYHSCKDLVQTEMARSYKEAMKSEIGIEADPSFLEYWNKDAALPVQFSAYDVALNEQARPGFEGYRRRLETFVKRQPDSWAERFGAPPG